MKILAIDTTEAGCSAALLDTNEVLEHCKLTPRQHTEYLLPMIDGVLAEAQTSVNQLDGLGFARGPGSFTGVRIATAAIQGIAVALDLPVAPISSLLALAQGTAREHQANQVLAGLDARMHEVYWAECVLGDDGLMHLQNAESVGAPSSVAQPHNHAWTGAGSAWGEYADELQNRLGARVQAIYADAQIHAQDVARLAQRAFSVGNGVSAEHALPVYLRNQVAAKPKII